MESRFLTFVKIANRWFIHLPEYEGDVMDLEMVMSADKFCEILDRFNVGIIKISVSNQSSENKFTVREYTLKRKEFFGEGAYYVVKEIGLELWLCNVTKYVLGEFPETIYVQI